MADNKVEIVLTAQDQTGAAFTSAQSGVARLGDSAGQAAQQFDASTASMIESIKRTTAAAESGGRASSAYFEALAKQRGVSVETLRPYLDGLKQVEVAQAAARASLNGMGMSAAQMSNNLRMVPAQMTDIVVSLASGQQPLTVLLQQGGQLKDVFGGTGAAAKAIGTYVIGLVNPFTVAAAAAAGIGYAFYAGSKESDEFRKNLILTGNASGLTVDKFNAMAVAMSGFGGVTRGAAAEALTEMAASGNIGAASIERLTRSALLFEKSGGPAVADTVKQFEDLGKSPVDASVKLNEKTHYLTLAIYEQIKALEDQGKISEAAVVAQNAWADAIDKRTPQMVQNLGYIEAAWKGIKGAATGAWDWAKDIGRDETDAEKMLRLQRTAGRASMALEDPTRYFERDRLKAIKGAAEQELKILVDASNKKKELAKGEADAAEKNQAKVAAAVKYDKLIDDQASKAVKQRKEMQLLDADRAAGLVGEEKYAAAAAAIRKKYEDKSALRADASAAKKAAREAAEEQRKLDDLLAQGGGESKTYAESMALLQKYALSHADTLKAGTPELERYRAAVIKLITTQTDSGKAWKESTDAAEAAGKALRVWQAENQSRIAASAEETSAVGQSAAARKLALAGLQVEAEARKKIEQLSLSLSASDRKAAVDAINAEKDKQKALIDTALRKQQAVEGAYQLEQENRRFAADSILDERERAWAILEIESETWRERIQMAAEGSEERKRLEAAFQGWYANQAVKPTIDAARKALDTIDQTIHDSAVRLMEQGKPGWEAAGEALGNAFRAAAFDEIYKLTLKPIIVNIVGAFTSGVASSIGAQEATEAAGGAAQAQQGLGMLSGLQTAFSGLTGGVNKAATSFATSGFGQAAGLSTAPGVVSSETAIGTLQVETAGGLTAAGSTFAAAAGPVLGALAATYAIAEMNKGGWGNENNGKGYAKSFITTGDFGTSVVLDRLFGHNRNISNDAQGITGTFDASGFAGQSFQEKSQKGGAFRSDKRWTDYGAIGADMDKALDSMLKQAVSGVQAIGKTLGVEAGNAMEGFSHTFALQLSENGDMSKAGEKIAAEIKKVQDELVTKLVPNIEDFARYGESAADTFGRLNQEVTATDAILLAMGKNAGEAFGAVGLASIKAREDLIDLAGGLDKLASKTQAFYQAYYSSSEQQQLAAKQAQQVLVTGFADIGQSIPASRAAFRGLVEAQDLSTEAGRKLWNSLLDLSDEFDTVQKLADAAAESTKAATQSQASLFDSFASDAQKLDAARKLVGDTFASIGKDVPASSAAFLQLTQAIDPATEAGQQMIAALQKVGGAFAYVQTTAAAAAKATLTTAAAAAKATLTGQASKIEGDMQSLVARFGSLSPVARTVADDLAATQQQLAGLSDGLANLFGGKQLTDLEKLGQTVNYRTQIRGAISQLNDDIFEAALKGMSRPQQIEQLKKAEADLWAGMASAADKGQQASQIRSVVLRRLGLESDEANGAASKVADLAKQARQDQIETLRTQIDGMQRMRDLAGQIADFTANLSIGDLSPLSYADQLSAAQAQFEQTLGKAKGGDQQAQGQLTNNAKTYLDEARSYFASSTDYAAIYEKVTGSLKSIASPADSTLTAAQAQLDTLSKLPDVMAAMVDTSKDDVAALQAVQAALRSGDDYLTKSIDAQTVALQKQIDTLTTIASNQDAQIKQAGAAYQQMTDELKAVKAQLAAIEANGALAGAA